MTRVETHAALMEAVEIYREKIKKKAVIKIKDFVFTDHPQHWVGKEKSKHTKMGGG